MTNPAPPRDAPIELVEVTAANYREAFRLSVRPDQEGFVAPNAVSLAQAHFHPEAWPRLLVAGGTPVGFAMLEDWSPCPEKAPDKWREERYVGLWRFMIGAPYQRSGFGGRAMERLVAHARTVPGTRAFYLSFVDADGGPEAFYRRFGFERTGEIDEGEVVMRLAL